MADRADERRIKCNGVQNFCFVVPLRIAAYFVGAVDCLLRCLGIGIAIYVIFFSDTEKNTFIYALYGCELTLMVTIVPFAVLLIAGVHKNKANYLLPWILTNCAYISLELTDAGYFFAVGRSPLLSFLYFLSVAVIYSYLVICMSSLYCRMKEETV